VYRYYTIRVFNVDWKANGFNLAHVTKNEKNIRNQNVCAHCQVSSVSRFESKSHKDSPGGIRKTGSLEENLRICGTDEF